MVVDFKEADDVVCGSCDGKLLRAMQADRSCAQRVANSRTMDDIGYEITGTMRMARWKYK